MTTLETWMHRIASVFALAGGLALVVLGAVTVVSVFYRYVLRDPIFGIEDLSTMSLTVVVAASVAWAAVQKGHVSVNVLPMFAGRAVSRVTDAISRTLSVGVLAIASYALADKGGCGLPCGALTSNLSIIHTPFYYVLSAAMGFVALHQLLHLIVGLMNWSGDDPNEVAD